VYITVVEDDDDDSNSSDKGTYPLLSCFPLHLADCTALNLTTLVIAHSKILLASLIHLSVFPQVPVPLYTAMDAAWNILIEIACTSNS